MAGYTVAGETYRDLDGQLFEIKRQLRQPGGYPFDPSDLKLALQAIIEGRFGHVPNGTSNLNWLLVYEKLGLSAEYTEFAEANKATLAGRPGIWTTPVLKGVTCNKEVAALRKLGVTMSLFTKDLDASITVNDRDPNKTGSYVVSFAANVEADENLRNLSANQLAEQGVKGITLLERLILELAYFLTTGKHLDQINITLCSGSRRSDGGVPLVHWRVDDRLLCVFWSYPDLARDHLRTRAAA